MHRRTKATAIPKAVKERVWMRDGQRCIFCGKVVPVECACAHYIARSQGGLGIEQNVLTLCNDCHTEYDNGRDRKRLKAQARAYLEEEYGVIDEDDLIYQKWEW